MQILKNEQMRISNNVPDCTSSAAATAQLQACYEWIARADTTERPDRSTGWIERRGGVPVYLGQPWQASFPVCMDG